MRRNNYAFSAKPLFPPVVPNSVPAFLAEGTFKFFFKKSVANFANIINSQPDFDKFNQVHIAINSLETNSNAIDTRKHPTGFICVPLSNLSLDTPMVELKPNNVYRVFEKDAKTPYCIVLNGKGESFQEEDKLYKVQIRLGNWHKIPSSIAEMREMERDSKATSEWSAVSMIKPISKPDFGLYKFKQAHEFNESDEFEYNSVGTANFEYIGYFNSIYDTYDDNAGYKTSAGTERLVEYSFKLYDGTGKKLLSESGPINLVEHDRKNISYSFNYLTQDGEYYYVHFTIKTENGYEETKIYPIKAVYVVLQMSNAMVRVSEERDYARMKLQIQAKQVVLEPILKPGTEEMSKMEFVKDLKDPMYQVSEAEQEKIVSTHAMVEGTVSASKSFYLVCPRDIWIMETKIMGLQAFATRDEAMKHPYIYLENEHLMDASIPYLTQVRLIAYEKIVRGLGATTKIITDPATGIKSLEKVNNDKKVYIVEAIKSSYQRTNGKNELIATQSVKKEMVSKVKYEWKEEINIEPNPARPPIMQEIDLSMDSRWNYKKHTTDELIMYPLDQEVTDADPEEKKVTKYQFTLAEPKPINPLQEFYVFITSYMGGFGMEITENKIVIPNPNDPIHQTEIDYITDNPVLRQFLLTKKIPPKEQKEE